MTHRPQDKRPRRGHVAYDPDVVSRILAAERQPITIYRDIEALFERLNDHVSETDAEE